MEAVVSPRGDGSEWTSWRYESTGRTAEEGTERTTFGILRDIMDSFPQELATFMVLREIMDDHPQGLATAMA
jgi:hypothetical protein